MSDDGPRHGSSTLLTRTADSVSPWLLGAAFVLGLALPLASLAPFRFGYWVAAEPLVVGLHLCAGLAACGLALAATRSDGIVTGAFRSPIVLLPLALGVFSMVTAPLAPAPILSLLGPPQSGQGALWYVEFALLIAAARVMRTMAGWKALRRLAILAVMTVAGLKGFDWWWEQQGGRNLLIWVAAYYAWLGLALPVLCSDAETRWRWLGWAASVAVVLAGRSATAGLAAALALGVIVAGRLAGDRRWARWGLIGLPLVPLVAVPPLLLFLPMVDGSLSLTDRRSLLWMVGEALAHWTPDRWAFGLGWGRTQDVFHTYLASSGQVLWDGSWIFMASDYFHSHSALAEALLAAGVPGLVLTAAWYPAIVMGARPDKRVMAGALAVALASLGAMWFQLSLSLPLTALALASVCPDVRPRPAAPMPAQRRAAHLSVAAACIAAAFAFLASASSLYHFGRAVQATRQDIQALSPTPRPFPTDPRGGDLAAARTILDGIQLMGTLAPDRRDAALPAARMMATYLARRIPATGTMLLPITGLGLQAQIHTSGQLAWLAPQLPDDDDAAWARWLDRALDMAPERTDLAIPYLGHLAVQGRRAELGRRVAAILAVNAGDPVGLYFQGLLTVQEPSPEAKRRGIALLRASVSAGMERFMPLDPTLKALLGR